MEAVIDDLKENLPMCGRVAPTSEFGQRPRLTASGVPRARADGMLESADADDSALEQISAIEKRLMPPISDSAHQTTAK